MRKCEKCGIYIENEVKYCPVCGLELESGRKSDQNCRQDGYQDTVPSSDNNDHKNNKAMAILAYLGCLVLIPMFAAKDSRFVKYHIRQGLILLITELIFYVGYCILSFTILSISWRLYFIVKAVGLVRYLFPVLTVIGMINAANGKKKALPVIGNIG